LFVVLFTLFFSVFNSMWQIKLATHQRLGEHKYMVSYHIIYSKVDCALLEAVPVLSSSLQS